MAEPREYQVEALIIRKIKLGEADRILSLYTPDMGKIEAVAKGVRRPKSKLAGHLELLTHSRIRLARGRNLDTITGSETVEGFLDVKNDILLTSCGLYIAELINQFTPERVSDPGLFYLLLDTLSRLSSAANTELILRYFELSLLNKTGYRPQLQTCVACDTVLKPLNNAFCSMAGGVLCPECALEHPSGFPISVDAIKVLRLFQTSGFDTVIRLKMNSGLNSELKTLLGDYIRFLLEREVKSAAWLDALQQQIQTRPE
ncbi:MAG: DNA repair protein RecO [Dehalococcoidales bacterium]|nr:DNA repair protein RecO [Dehalococcoidales bacterium]